MIKRQALIASILVCYLSPALADIQSLTKAIDKKIKETRISKDYLSIFIADSHGEKIYTLNEDRKIIPASLSKLATASAVLEKMPVGYQFITEIRVNESEVKGNELNGDLYLRGGGDAGFVSESMWFLVNEFLRNGITKIKGDVVVDDTIFDSVRFDDSREQSRVDNAYDAPIGAMTFNWSAVNIFTRPGKKVGDLAQVFVDPINDYIMLVNQTKTTKAGGKTEISVSNAGLNSTKEKETIYVRGKIPLDAEEKVDYKSIGQPGVWAGHQLKQFLKQRDISVSGKVRLGKAAVNSKVVATHKSKAVGEIVSDMLKFSNNYIAEILTKNLAVVVKKTTGTMPAGVGVIRDYLSEIGIKNFNFENPSGLTRKNLFTTKDIVSLLRHVKSQFSIYPEYLTGLPIAGVDGTLKRRIKKEDFKGRVRAKTGHLSGVNGLAGFMSDSEGNAYPFVFIYNGPVKDAYGSQYLFDKIIVEFLKEN